MTDAMRKIWTVSEAKARLSELMRRARKDGPQHIGTRDRFVLVTAEEWTRRTAQDVPLGQWLVDNAPCGDTLELPDRKEASVRPIPFDDEKAS